MNKACMVWRGLLSAVAMGIVMLLVPVAASAFAHDTGNHAHVSWGTSPAHRDAISSSGPDGVIPSNGHRLHCHLLSAPAMVVGANQPGDDGQATAPARATPAIVALHVRTHSPLSPPIPIAASPPYILFGNFRS